MFMYILATCIVLVTILYFHVRQKMSYWKTLGVAEDQGYFPLGSESAWSLLSQKISIMEITDKIYKSFPDQKIIGSYGIFGKPSIVFRDLDLAKRIMIKDFDHFVDRITEDGNIADTKSKNGKYLAKMLVQMRGDEWKHMRSTLSPVFTSGRLKSMVPLIHKVADECNEYLQGHCDESMDMKELMGDFSLDVIISTAFGIDHNIFKNPDSVFKTQAKKLTGEGPSWKLILGIFLFYTFPKLVRWLDLPIFFDPSSGEFFAELVRTSMKERKEEGIRRNDLIDLIIDAIEKESKPDQANGENTDDLSQYDKDAELKDAKPKRHRWSDDELEIVLISNALMTFSVAFDQVSNASSKMLYHLAKNPDIQTKLYEEITNKTNEPDQSKYLDYAAAMSLPYMDVVFHETLRSYPLGHLERITTKDYKIPDTDVIIPKGMTVRVAYPGIMKDEQFFPDAERFNPENFSPEAKSQRDPYAYSGFGHGPRNCIAMRFAIMQVKLVISRIVAAYKVLPCEKTVDKLIPDPKSLSGQPKGGLWVKFEKR